MIGYILHILRISRHFRQSKKEHGYICNALKEYQDILDTLKRESLRHLRHPKRDYSESRSIVSLTERIIKAFTLSPCFCACSLIKEKRAASMEIW